LEGSGTVGHSEEHHKRFEEAAISMEGCLLFVSGLDTYIIETPSDIKLCEVLGSVKLEDELGDEGEGVPVLNGYGIQHTIVLDQLERTMFLFNEEHRGCDGGFGGITNGHLLFVMGALILQRVQKCEVRQVTKDVVKSEV